MLNLPKNNPDDESLIKKANNDPNWPADIDNPCDWDRVGLWSKIWFKIGDTVKMLIAIFAIGAIVIACHETFFKGGNGMDEPRCDPGPTGCVEYYD